MASTISLILTKFLRDQSNLKYSFSILWWVHLFLSLAFLSYIPFSRLFHLFSSPLNIFFRNLEDKGALSKLDLDTSETYGVGRIEEFTWRNLLELDACTRCGRCQETCPTHLSQKALNPKKMIQDLKKHMESPFMEGLNGRNKQSSSKALECGHLRLRVKVLVPGKTTLSWP